MILFSSLINCCFIQIAFFHVILSTRIYLIFVVFLFIIFSCYFINLFNEFDFILLFILYFLTNIISFFINFYLIRGINWFIILIFNIFFCFISLEILLNQSQSNIINFFWFFHSCQRSYKISCLSFRCLYQ
jgi:hypothetical protein